MNAPFGDANNSVYMGLSIDPSERLSHTHGLSMGHIQRYPCCRIGTRGGPRVRIKFHASTGRKLASIQPMFQLSQ